MKHKLIILIVCLFAFKKNYSQYNFIVDKLFGKQDSLKFLKIEGNFTIEATDKSENEKLKIYDFKNKENIQLKYYNANEQGLCDAFSIFNKKISMKGSFEDDRIACNLDISSFEIYKFCFHNKKYLLIQSIRLGSGTATSLIIFHLFDITNLNSIKYYPLWSMYGSTSCFADFNHDGKLDFLNIRDNWKSTGSNTFKATISKIDETSKLNPDEGKYAIFKKTYDKNDDITITVLEKHGF